MYKIMDYSSLLEQMFGVSNPAGSAELGDSRIRVSDLSNPTVQAKLKAVGIDTNSAQYKTVIGDMLRANKGGIGYTNIQAIKNRMRYYDEDGDHINQAFGVSGLTVTDKNRASKNTIISISEDIRNEMFELTKREFLQENGAPNGETTRRSDIYRKMYPTIAKQDRLAAGHTLSEYEKQYLQAFKDAVKAADPKWEEGKPILAGVLDKITRESVEATLSQSNGKLVRKGVDFII